ncbi:hypothetical protein AB0I22_15405 [Streptomyces sp. NPDC050610]|uniref:DUF7848 domain-containing protein n=1 Tax=Streptomyces sp. NPDC050610 TaxID=3157097 RepID=UPI003435B6FF
MKHTLRHAPWTFEQDPTARYEYSAECAAGADEGCGERLHSWGPDWVEEWMRRHTQSTGHTRYRRTVDDYVVLNLPGELRVVPGEVIQPRPALPVGGGGA